MPFEEWGIARQPARIAAHPHHQTFDQRQEIRRPAPAHQIRHQHHPRQPRRRGSDSLSGHGVAGGRPRDGRRLGEGDRTGGRPAGQFDEETARAEPRHDLRRHRPRRAARLDSAAQRPAAGQTGAGGRPADRGDPDRPFRHPLPSGDLHHHERQPDVARGGHHALPGGRGYRRGRRFRRLRSSAAVTAG